MAVRMAHATRSENQLGLSLARRLEPMNAIIGNVVDCDTDESANKFLQQFMQAFVTWIAATARNA